MIHWMGPGCIHYDGKRGHYGEERHECKCKDRNTLNGFWGRLFKLTNCIMTIWDDDDYCPLFVKHTLPMRPPAPPPGRPRE